MGFFDKILGKEEKVEKMEKKSKRGDSISTKEIESPNVMKRPVSVKAEKEKDKPVKKPVAKKPAEKPKAKPAGKKMMKREENIAHRIVLEPIISEKSTTLGAENKYVFKVSQNSSKFQIKEAIEEYYGVGVIGANTIKIHPKKRIHGRTIGYKKGYKKAIVTLRQGDTIGVTEGV